MRGEFNLPKALYLFDEGVEGVNFREIKGFVKETFGELKVYLHRLKNKVVKTDGLLLDFLATKKAFTPLETGCQRQPSDTCGVLSLTGFSELKSNTEKDACCIILSDKLFATFDTDNRPHIRASIYSFPSIISVPGIVEGPAKPKEYYFYKQRYAQLGIFALKEEQVKKKFKASFIDYKDRRLTKVVKGYLAQALFFHLTGNPYCAKRNCRLFNAHWQKDLIYAQIVSGRFCKVHKQLLQSIIS